MSTFGCERATKVKTMSLKTEDCQITIVVTETIAKGKLSVSPTFHPVPAQADACGYITPVQDNTATHRREACATRFFMVLRGAMVQKGLL
jgi:hypothetical protein